MDVKYFYLNNQMDISYYIMIQISIIPQGFIYKYNIKEKVHNEYIFAQASKGMYGFLQSEIFNIMT